MPSLTGNNVNVTVTTKADTRGITETEDALGGLSKKSAAIFGAIAGFAQVAAVQGISLITSSLGDAISRVDTLDNASRAFANMGFKADETKNMMNRLKESILGLPTPLNDAVSSVEILASSTGNLSKSQEIFTALNDGILGFGGSAADVKGAIIQLSQAFSNGKIDAQTWNSLMQNGMGPALATIAKQMGITTAALKDGLSEGDISVAAFQDSLIKLDKEGGGGMASLQKIAHDSTSGISTGMDNAKTAVVRGLAEILKAFGTSNISGAISGGGAAIEKFEKDVARNIPVVIKDFGVLTKYLKTELGPVVDAVRQWFEDLPAPMQLLLNPIGSLYVHIHNLSGYFREISKDVQDFWNVLKNNQIIIILSQFIDQVMVPAFKAIWGSITKDLVPALEGLWKSFSRLYDALEPGLTQALKVVGAIIGGILLAAIWVGISALNLFVKMLGGLATMLELVIGWLSNIIAWFGNLVGVVYNAVRSIITIIGNFGPAFRDVVSIIGSIIGGIGSLIYAPFKWAYDAVVGLFRNLPREMGNIVSGAFGSIGSAAKSVLHGLHIPGFAGGVQNFGGGLAVVGERGPELVNLPAGSSVYSNSESKGMLGGANITIQSLVLPGVTDRQSFIASLDQDVLLTGRGLTPTRGAM